MKHRKWTAAEGVRSVELPPPNSSVRERLWASVSEAQTLRASVAFWTVPHDYVSSMLPSAVSAPQGFVCTDLHLPTSIDRLAELVRAGGSVHLYMNRPAKRVRELWGKRGPRHLLHSKLLLFDRTDGLAELWVGSHNWTRPALGGLNVEASAILDVEVGSPIYAEAVDFLEHSRKLSEPFDLARLDEYKELQGGEDGMLVTEVEGERVAELKGQSVLLFAMEKVPTWQVPKSGTGIYLGAHDTSTGDLHVYKGEVLRSGVLGATHRRASVANWDAVRHSFQRLGDFPRLEHLSVPAASLSSGAYASVLVALDTKLPAGTRIGDLPDIPNWVPSWDDPLESEAPERELDDLKGRRKGPLIEKPNPDRRQGRTFATLDEKRQRGSQGLFERKQIEPAE